MIEHLRKPVADTGVTISPVGFGTVKLGRDQQVKYPEAFRIPDDREAASLLAQARELGINLLDTAPAYGSSEERLGHLIADDRASWVICTKVGEEFENGESRFDFTPEHLRFSIERSLKRLGTDYLDMVLVHSSGDDVDIIRRYGCLDVLAELKREGLVRASGMSTKTVEGGILALEQSDCAMVTWNLNEQGERAVLDYARDHGKAILVKKALASGHLCSDGDDPVQTCMDFVFSHAGVSAAVLGTINPDHLRHNVHAVLQAVEKHAA
ncbi:aldo/keto reductase [Kistimonas scapharcae]|uniref:Aldo/keto reductase n=1 Tax=Kistimonas scapharcae TaxID=1036133 RepID=A0ABP8UX44_9GAMM